MNISKILAIIGGGLAILVLIGVGGGFPLLAVAVLLLAVALLVP